MNHADFQLLGRNLNNEVFGVYQGSPQYFIQRKPTYEFGFRWDMSHER